LNTDRVASVMIHRPFAGPQFRSTTTSPARYASMSQIRSSFPSVGESARAMFGGRFFFPFTVFGAF
jgi:hypothetical protein